MNNTLHTAKKGFTLLELLIVIAVIAVLSAILIFILDPTETLAKARDSQRISDLGSLKTAMGIYLTGTTTPQLDGISGTRQDKCLGGAGVKTVFASVDSGAVTLSNAALTGSNFTAWGQVSSANNSLTDGTGWVPVNLNSITGGSPISNLPIDPTNTAAATPLNTDFFYRYACRKSPLTFEINAKLESIAFTTTDNRAQKDGGNNTLLYEAGTDLSILPTTGSYTF